MASPSRGPGSCGSPLSISESEPTMGGMCDDAYEAWVAFDAAQALGSRGTTPLWNRHSG